MLSMRIVNDLELVSNERLTEKQLNTLNTEESLKVMGGTDLA